MRNAFISCKDGFLYGLTDTIYLTPPESFTSCHASEQQHPLTQRTISGCWKRYQALCSGLYGSPHMPDGWARVSYCRGLLWLDYFCCLISHPASPFDPVIPFLKENSLGWCGLGTAAVCRGVTVTGDAALLSLRGGLLGNGHSLPCHIACAQEVLPTEQTRVVSPFPLCLHVCVWGRLVGQPP